MKKIILGLLTISLVSFLVYSCTKESATSNISSKSIQKSTVASIKPPRTLEEYMLLENYVRQNIDISHEQFVQYGNVLAFVNNQLSGFQNSSYTEFLSPEQFVKINKLIFKASISIKSNSENSFFTKVNGLVKDVDPIAPTNVICYDKQTPFNYCNPHPDAQCCCLVPIYEKYYN